jgi:UDP-glucuronate 4-epimerase
MAHYLLTGVAGFIASKVAELLLDEGHTVLGLDNLNNAYDVRLKQWRLAQLDGKPGFEFQKLDITDNQQLRPVWEAGARPPFDAVINLAARAGVRQNPSRLPAWRVWWTGARSWFARSASSRTSL